MLPAATPPATLGGTGPKQVDKRDVIEAINSWAKKWSAKDVKGYLSAYADDFKPSGGLTRQKWASQRRERLRKPHFIQVKVDKFRVEFTGDRQARITFDQEYQSDNYSDHVQKTLLMELKNGHWLITEETSD